jgi:hypothetical protein
MEDQNVEQVMLKEDTSRRGKVNEVGKGSECG